MSFQIKKACCEQHAFTGKYLCEDYITALFTAYGLMLRQDQIYNIPYFMASKLFKIFNFQERSVFFLMFFGKIIFEPEI